MKETLGNKDWMMANEDHIKNLFPDEWTNVDKLNGLKIGYGFKLLGIDWRSESDFVNVMMFLTKFRIIIRKGCLVRRNPMSVFSKPLDTVSLAE